MSNVSRLPDKPRLNYYTYSAVLSRNAVFNFIVGARGVGKTYGAKRKAIRDYIHRGDQFIYLRRYGTELKSALPSLFADMKSEFPDVVFRVTGSTLEVSRSRNPRKPEWEVMGWGIALSQAQQKKSVSYPNVKTIIYDEFIIERGMVHYLPNEARAFNDFYSTVDRWKDKTRVFFLANSISVMNPYFIEYDIRPNKDTEWIVTRDGYMCAHFPRSEEFAKGVYETRFGQFISGSEYADYSVGSTFGDNDDTMIARKRPEHKYYCTLETKNGTFSIWIDLNGPSFHVQTKRPKQEIFWTLLPDRMDENKALVLYTDKVIQSFRTGFARGRMTFGTPQARNAFLGLYKR